MRTIEANVENSEQDGLAGAWSEHRRRHRASDPPDSQRSHRGSPRHVGGRLLIRVSGLLPRALPGGIRTGWPGAGDSTPDGAIAQITVAIAGNTITPKPDIHRVRKGQTVRITVTSDRADEIHVHGYDKTVALEPGKPATVEFVANVTGRFEVETHKTAKQLFQLEVR